MTSSVVKRMSPAARLATGVGGAAAVAILAAACSSGSGTSSGTGTAAGSGSTVITTASSSGGMILTDGSGRAVYLWVVDKNGKSVCSGACAGAWPPVLASGTVTTSGGAKSSDLGSFTRSDGSKQVTYDGHPLYYYAGDSGAGMASGQGSDSFGAKWWLVSPGGSDVTASVTSFTTGGGGSAPTTKGAVVGGY